MDFSLGVQDCVRCSRADWGNASVVACLCGRRQLGPCLLWNREGSPAHRCGAVSLMNFTDTVRLLAEQPLRHYASPDCAVPRVGGGQDCSGLFACTQGIAPSMTRLDDYMWDRYLEEASADTSEGSSDVSSWHRFVLASECSSCKRQAAKVDLMPRWHFHRLVAWSLGRLGTSARQVPGWPSHILVCGRAALHLLLS